MLSWNESPNGKFFPVVQLQVGKQSILPVFSVLIRGHAVFPDKSFIERIGAGIMDLADDPTDGKICIPQEFGGRLDFLVQNILYR